MSGETEEDVSGWTVDTLHVHIQRQLQLLHAEIDRRLARVELISGEHTASLRAEFRASFEAQEKAVAAALAAQEKAVAAALVAAREANEIQAEEVRVWRIAQNEWRGAMSDREQKFMPREEALAIVATEGARFLALNEGLDRRVEDLRKEFDKLDKRMDLREGARAGISGAAAMVIAGIGTLVVLVNLGIYALGQ